MSGVLGRSVSIAAHHEGDMVTVRTWRITGDEAAALEADFLARFGPAGEAMAPADVLREFDDDPRVVSTEDGP